MTKRSWLWCWVAMIILWPVPVTADTLYLTDGNVMFGRVLSTDAQSVLFNQRLQNGDGYRQRNIERSAIKTLVINIHPDQLSEVDPANPDSYYAIAEILDPQQLDPEARDLAIRLYLLAAANGSPSLRNTSLRKLIPLARDPWEQKKFNALANRYLTDGRFELPTLVPSTSQLKPPSTEESERLKTLQESLTALRTNNRSDAADTIGQNWVEQTMDPFRNITSWRELRQWSIAPELKTEWLARIVELELAIDATLRPTKNPADSTPDWSRLANQEIRPLSPIDFHNATEFDLSKNQFREGVWIADPGQ